MKILTIIPSLGLGGAELMTIYMLNELASKGIKQKLVILTKRARFTERIDKSVEIEILKIPQLQTINRNGVLKAFQQSSHLKSIIKDFQPTDIIASLPISHFIVRASSFRLKETPNIWFYHHSTEYENKTYSVLDQSLKKLQVFFDRNLHSSHLFISEAVKDNIITNYPVKSGYVLYNALPTINIRTEESTPVLQEYSLIPEKYVVIPGRLHKVKGHSLVLNNCRKIFEEYSLKLVFIGEGPEEDNLLELISINNWKDNVILTGALDNRKLLAIVKNAKLLLTPSVREGLGNVAIEGLMMGTTILSSNAGGLPEVLEYGKMGYIFESNNSEDLKEKLVEILQNYKVKKLDPIKLHNSFLKRFSTKSQVEKLLDLFNMHHTQKSLN